jgi:hypothetical protein
MANITPMSLRILATDGTVRVMMPATMQHYHLGVPPAIGQPGRITEVTYTEYTGGLGQGSQVPTTVAVAQFNGGNNLYEIGVYSDSGMFLTVFSNR